MKKAGESNPRDRLSGKGERVQRLGACRSCALKPISSEANSGVSKTRRRGVPTALQAIRPMVAGIDVGSREHWVRGPARADGEGIRLVS
jgi:hypothetical protein